MNFNDLTKSIYDKDDLKFEMWSEHRKIIKNVIEKRLGELKISGNKSVGIWGAGKCYDIDLNYLSNKFNKVVLMDINEDSMLDAIKLHNVTDKRNIEIKKVDFMINTNKIYMEFSDLINNKHDIDELKAYLEDLEKSIENHHEINMILDKYDISVCLGVHSQILVAVNLMLFQAKKIYDESDVAELIDIFRRCKKEAERRLNSAIINHSKDLLFVGFDLMELSLKNDTERFYSLIQDNLIKNDIESVIKIAMQYPVSGAVQAAEDVWERIINEELRFDGFDAWIWDYDMEKSYVFVLETILKI